MGIALELRIYGLLGDGKLEAFIPRGRMDILQLIYFAK